jgi:membrane-associated protease RseP (regulator of RpoE activity)
MISPPVSLFPLAIPSATIEEDHRVVTSSNSDADAGWTFGCITNGPADCRRIRVPKRVVFRLAEAVVLFLLFLLPLMLILASAEGTARQPTLLFWLLWLLPFLFLPWLWARRNPEERGDFALATDTHVLSTTQLARLGDIVAPALDVQRAYVRGGIPVVEGRLRSAPSAALDKLQAELAPHGLMPLIESAGHGAARVIALPSRVSETMRRRSNPAVNVVLFVATVLTTIWAGALHEGVNLIAEPGRFMVGASYAGSLLAILGVHEMGHFILSKRHGVEVTWPYFIPVPLGLGTLGAFIQIKSPIRSRAAVFDIGVAGPLAGLMVAIPALLYGLSQAEPLAQADGLRGTRVGSSILLAVLYQIAHGGSLVTAAESTIQLTPVAFAGWIGLVVTALNLLPVGQLDGGHIAYGLFGRQYARMIGVATFIVMVALGLTVWPGLLTWALMIALIAGFDHMPALDDISRPDAKRFVVGMIAMLLLAMIALPLPSGFAGMLLDCPYI